MIEQFKTDAAKALGFDVAVESGYKLCDFKPAYGHIFADYIREYDFWGYCDVDVIFGNIRSFITDELLSEYDVINARHDYLTGCFSLYRNTPYFRELFRQSKDYQRVFTDTRNFFFDETNFAFEAFEKSLHYSQIRTEVESMTHVVRRLQEENKLKAYFEFQIVEGFAGNMLRKQGKLIYRKQFEACFTIWYGSNANMLNRLIYTGKFPMNSESVRKKYTKDKKLKVPGLKFRISGKVMKKLTVRNVYRGKYNPMLYNTEFVKKHLIFIIKYKQILKKRCTFAENFAI